MGMVIRRWRWGGMVGVGKGMLHVECPLVWFLDSRCIQGGG